MTDQVELTAEEYKLLWEKQKDVADKLRHRLALAQQTYQIDLAKKDKQIYLLQGYQWRAKEHDALLKLLYEINDPLRDLLGVRFVRYGVYDYKRTIWNWKKYQVAVLLAQIYELLECDDK